MIQKEQLKQSFLLSFLKVFGFRCATKDTHYKWISVSEQLSQTVTYVVDNPQILWFEMFLKFSWVYVDIVCGRSMAYAITISIEKTLSPELITFWFVILTYSNKVFIFHVEINLFTARFFLVIQFLFSLFATIFHKNIFINLLNWILIFFSFQVFVGNWKI